MSIHIPLDQRMRRPQPVVILLQNNSGVGESRMAAARSFLMNVTIILQSMNQGRQRHHLSIATFGDSVCSHSFAIEPRAIRFSKGGWPFRSENSGVNVAAALAWASIAIRYTETWIINNPMLINASPQDALWPVCFYIGDGANSGDSAAKEALKLQNLEFMGNRPKVIAVNTAQNAERGCLLEVVGSEELITWPDGVLDDHRMSREWLPDTDQTIAVPSKRPGGALELPS